MPGYSQNSSQIAIQNDFENNFTSKPELVENVEARKT